MTLGQHLVARADGTWQLHFPGEHTKTGKRLDFGLDAEVSRWLSDYLELARRRFPRAASTDQLWMGMKGPLGREGFQRICLRHTFAWFGLPHRPHIFRKWLRASAARRAPDLVLDSEAIMGHSTEVALQHYAEAAGLHAGLRYSDRLAARRARLAGRAERAFAELHTNCQEEQR